MGTVRIPLDYYRILGVPIQSTPEDIQQAYEDRHRQLPHERYSSVAIAARQELLDAAYRVLGDAEQRRVYNDNLLTQSSPGGVEVTSELKIAEAKTATGQLLSLISEIEIPEAQLVGALILLYESGEYNTVLELGRPRIGQGKLYGSGHPLAGSGLLENDVVLSVALACREVGREEWQQRRYEKAATALQEALDLLLSEGLFAEVQKQLQADLYRLRPYRILELLAVAEPPSPVRQQGLEMFKAMLAERGGVDGNGNDQSGLGIDDCLKFVQQLRGYLTVAEQQEIFEAETRRPSAVGTYLSIYALIARGFAERQPGLIRRGKTLLRRLSAHQDVYLEQASCTLLLGQTEEAMAALEHSRDYEALAYIRDYARDYGDDADNLLPGLYYYTQRWLEKEVYPYFRDLATRKVDLKGYFDDEQVQQYLDSLGPEPMDTGVRGGLSERVVSDHPVGVAHQGLPDPWESSELSSARSTRQIPRPDLTGTPRPEGEFTSDSQLTFGSTAGRSGNPIGNLTSDSQTGNSIGNAINGFRNGASGSPVAPSFSDRGIAPNDESLIREAPREPGQQGSRPRLRRIPAWIYRGRLLGLFLGAVLLVGGIGALAKHLHLFTPKLTPEPGPIGQGSPTSTAPPPVSTIAPVLDLTQPPVPIPTEVASLPSPTLSPTASPSVGMSASPRPSDSPSSSASPVLGSPTTSPVVGPTVSPVSSLPTSSSPTSSPTISPVIAPVMNSTAAQQVIQTWQRSKAAALGEKHDTAGMEAILTDPALTGWRNSANRARERQSYYQYQLNDLQIESVTETDANRAIVLARISETANFYERGKPQPGSSYNDNYRVRYILVRQGDQWLIREMMPLGSI